MVVDNGDVVDNVVRANVGVYDITCDDVVAMYNGGIDMHDVVTAGCGIGVAGDVVAITNYGGVAVVCVIIIAVGVVVVDEVVIVVLCC